MHLNKQTQWRVSCAAGPGVGGARQELRSLQLPQLLREKAEQVWQQEEEALGTSAVAEEESQGSAVADASDPMAEFDTLETEGTRGAPKQRRSNKCHPRQRSGICTVHIPALSPLAFPHVQTVLRPVRLHVRGRQV